MYRSTAAMLCSSSSVGDSGSGEVPSGCLLPGLLALATGDMDWSIEAWHGPHMRKKPAPWIDRLGAHRPQNTSPHCLQWCFLCIMPKAALHDGHAWTTSSGVHFSFSILWNECSGSFSCNLCMDFSFNLWPSRAIANETFPGLFYFPAVWLRTRS